MTDIYQRIYDADVNDGSGVQAFFKGSQTGSDGHVIVTESVDESAVRDLLSEVFIPESKKRSYDLAEALFDNYDLLSSVRDEITPEEAAEVDELLDYIVDRAPMALARDYIEKESGRPFSDAAWYALVKETWFRPFAIGSSPTRSGFEHVFLGEWKARSSSVGGLHWWYYYFAKMDKMDYGGAKYGNADPRSGIAIPEIATMTFAWDVGARTIYKRIGGFFIGLSVEGLMAMGMVRSSNIISAPNIAQIQGAELDLKLFKSPDNRSVNTFYPVFRRALISVVTPTVDPAPPTFKPVTPTGVNGNRSKTLIRLISVLANPAGQDEGHELVTLLNLHSEVVNLQGWRVVGPNKSFLSFGNVSLEPGNARTFSLPSRKSLQLSNKGGSVSVKNPEGNVVQSLEYSARDAGVQGAVLIWDGSSKLIRADA